MKQPSTQALQCLKQQAAARLLPQARLPQDHRPAQRLIDAQQAHATDVGRARGSSQKHSPGVPAPCSGEQQ